MEEYAILTFMFVCLLLHKYILHPTGSICACYMSNIVVEIIAYAMDA